MKTVVIGGVAGGASAAARLRRLDEKADIILLERGEYISYANCGLPYFIGGEITDKEELTLQTPQSFRNRFAVDVRIRQEAITIDPARKIVLVRNLENGKDDEECYDKLILAPGAEPVRPPLPGIEDARIFTLRTIPDTYRIQEHIQNARPKTVVIVGGGFIGLEMAENLVRKGIQVTVVESADHVIGPLDYDMACEVHRYLLQEGVKLLLGCAVKAFHPDEALLGVELANGGILHADMVLMSVGVRPDTGLAKSAGLETNARGALLVDEHMRTSNEHIYAVGDAVEVTHLVSKGPAYIPLAGPANKQGRIAADHICGLDSRYKGSQGSSILKLFDMTVASTGLNESGAKAAGLDFDKIHTYSASHATYYPGASNISMKTLFDRKTGHILGAQLIGFEGVDKRCDVLATAIRAGMTAYDLAELELCYAPPFSSAKDPVNMVGFAIENLLTHKVRQFHWHDVATARQNANTLILDVRTDQEYDKGYIPGAVHIPLNVLREKLSEIDRSKTVYVYCQSGLRSYIACRILFQNGFDCLNLSGGYRFYKIVTEGEY
ncbi:CoA-disulfide reductase [Syntrophobotulus glycolicus DSM 8271]|uniref:CoA-disulfide reductase n=1 Tax=Syntrophobotulus glycolicus (strain DSM 8271 / FlGlyR) TaxID=645991 RepID=F0SYZ6_SYNGF|nr:FAD-dependent oxidoreductase [Syntrophobotulus glycolicus]ADY56033.1 CoA-disulfide reductase [Syntrophobotulus glycolicus DSM 8271]